MVRLVEHLYASSALDLSLWFDELKGVRAGRPLGNGRRQSFVALYPRQPSLQFPHHGQTFETAHLSPRHVDLYRMVVAEDAEREAYLLEAIELAEFAYAVAIRGKGDDPRSSVVRVSRIEPSAPPLVRVAPSTPRLEPILTTPEDPFSRDPVEVDRGNEAHRLVIEALWRFLSGQGIHTVSVEPGPLPDLIWEKGSTLFVTEAKSLTPSNEDGQLRLGLGQVLDYREQYRQIHRWDAVQAVLLVETEPSSRRWDATCSANGVILARPGELARVL
jgi:hypothetical protein